MTAGCGRVVTTFFKLTKKILASSYLFSLKLPFGKESSRQEKEDFRSKVREVRDFFNSREAYRIHECGIIACAYSFAMDYFTYVPSDQSKYELSAEACLSCIKHRKHEAFVALVKSFMRRSSKPNLRIMYVADLLEAGLPWEMIEKIPASFYLAEYEVAFKFFKLPVGRWMLENYDFNTIFETTQMVGLFFPNNFPYQASLSRQAFLFCEPLFFLSCFREKEHVQELFRLLRAMFDSFVNFEHCFAIEEIIQHDQAEDRISPSELFKHYFEHYHEAVHQGSARTVKSYRRAVDFETEWKNILRKTITATPEENRFNLPLYQQLADHLNLQICSCVDQLLLAQQDKRRRIDSTSAFWQEESASSDSNEEFRPLRESRRS